jgi:hypothetical protein
MNSMKFVFALALFMGGAVVGSERPAEANSPSGGGARGSESSCRPGCTESSTSGGEVRQLSFDLCMMRCCGGQPGCPPAR